MFIAFRNSLQCVLLLLFLLALCAKAFPQICQGSLGDPVVKIDFGSGPNPGPPLTQSLPNLTYFNGSCPNDGFYTICNSIPNCYGGSWHTYATDHTPGDTDGYMMLINASITSGDFFVTTIKGLCPGSTYEFAAWITNIFYQNTGCASYVRPNLNFTIETISGTLLSTYNTGNIPENAPPGLWKQYGLFFVTPDNATDVVLRISNIGPGGCGNDLALDDITFRPCGPLVTINASTGNSSDISMCADAIVPVTIDATISAGYNNPAFIWQQSADAGSTWNDIGVAGSYAPISFTPTGAGITLLRLVAAEATNIANASCRTASNSIRIVVHALPAAAAGSNSPVCAGRMLQLNAGGGQSFLWQGPNGFSSNGQNPVFTSTTAAAGTYTVAVTDNNGCTASATTTVTILNAIKATVSADTSTCQRVPVQLNASGGTSYQWVPATGLSNDKVAAPMAMPDQTTRYRVTVSNGSCSDTAAVTVTVLQQLAANAGPDRVIAEGQSTTLQGSATGDNISWQWSPNIFINDISALSPMVSPIADQQYTLTVSSANGCPSASDAAFVRVYKKVEVPNAFSPNGDGINDTWRVDALAAYPESTVKVFDRYGRVVLQTPGSSLNWDGSRNGNGLPAATYYYLIDLKTGAALLQGSVSLLR